MAFDFETKGLCPSLPENSIRSVSLANDGGCIAIDLEGVATDCRRLVFDFLLSRPLVAHNYVFDGLWLAAETGQIVPAEFDTYGGFRQLATEGWTGQRWSLKVAMTDVLGWEDTNTADLDTWLSANKLSKEKMSYAPWEILGHYNALDSAATWQFYQYLLTFKDRFPVWYDFHTIDYANETVLLIEQQLDGLPIDMPKLTEYGKELDVQIESKLAAFLAHPLVAQHIATYNEFVVDTLIDNHPPQFRKDGETTKRWLNWKERVSAARGVNHFNTDSPKQLTWLFYEAMQLPVRRQTPKGLPSVDAKAISLMGEVGGYLIEYRNLRDLRKFVTAISEVQHDGLLHPSLRNPATITSRLSGGIDT